MLECVGLVVEDRLGCVVFRCLMCGLVGDRVYCG